MMDSMARRGPDSSGFQAWPKALLGHRRLAILDLSPAGDQPMLSADGQVGLVFNGCIYNFRSLRRQLEDLGSVFSSQCDTEVLLHGYAQWGIYDLVQRLRGMFAFGIWDNRKETLYLVRDRLGVKPLLYSLGPTGIAFASTARALASGDWTGSLSEAGVLEYLEFGYLGEESSIYQNVKKLQAGSILEFRGGTRREKPYWTLPEPSAGKAPGLQEAVDETERLLLESVRLRLEADVPIGALLSGGIDSSLVCWALKELGANVTAYTAGTGGEGDEAAAAAQTAQRIGIAHQVIAMPDHQEQLLENMSDAYGEPLGCSSATAMLQISQAIKPHAAVLLTGDGGDDIFLGYPYHRNYYLAQRLAGKLPNASPRLWMALRKIVNAWPSLRRPKHFLDYATGGLGAVTRVHDGLPYYERMQLLGPRLLELRLPQREIPLSIESARRLLLDALQYERRMQFNGEFLTKVDGATMFHSLEARSPLLDQELWEFAARLPLSLRLHGRTLKAILRALAERRLGPEVASRPKQGFTIPVEHWLLTRWQKAWEDLQNHPEVERQGWVAPQRFQVALAQAKTAGRLPKQLWHLLVFEQWLRRQKA